MALLALQLMMIPYTECHSFPHVNFDMIGSEHVYGHQLKGCMFGSFKWQVTHYLLTFFALDFLQIMQQSTTFWLFLLHFVTHAFLLILSKVPATSSDFLKTTCLSFVVLGNVELNCAMRRTPVIASSRSLTEMTPDRDTASNFCLFRACFCLRTLFPPRQSHATV